MVSSFPLRLCSRRPWPVAQALLPVLYCNRPGPPFAITANCHPEAREFCGPKDLNFQRCHHVSVLLEVVVEVRR